MEQKRITCPYYTELDTCNLVSTLAEQDYSPSPENCRACSLSSKPQTVNEVTTLLADQLRIENGLPKLHKLGDGPGTKLASLLTWFIHTDPSCGCETRAAIMDAWGVQGCRKNQNLIMHWLRDSAASYNMPYSSFLVSHLLELIYSSCDNQ
jgi:hypothetical protein